MKRGLLQFDNGNAAKMPKQKISTDSASQYRRNSLYLLFGISGFAGLIYESIWSHYLKLFLGHAAYAQTLVLAIFMGGMALGAWIASRYGSRCRNLLGAYAIIEAIIGLFGLVFHSVFVGATDVAYDSLIPALGSPAAIIAFKWSLATILILPQSVLLGATFPLMSAAVIRRYPQNPGANLAMLYFTNSIGAAIGVLVSGFILIETIGLPGTVLTAALINIAVAAAAWWFARNAKEAVVVPNAVKSTRDGQAASWRLLIAASFITGAASFIYEIGWIRMLSLVLGSSTHAFELMLSAFITGLAFGGLWMRNRIDQFKNPIHVLGWIQVVMGLLALATLVAYNSSFEVMRTLIHSLTPTDSGYFLFNLASHGIALVIMVPVTFCAGMTLPLITHILLRNRCGEKSIGAVYAANTLGAIVGVFFAVHIGMPMLGLKGLITSGAALDMALGVVLLAMLTKRSGRNPATVIASLIVLAALVFTLVGVRLDSYKMASGVYRFGQLYSANTAEIQYHQDGKTATVDLLKTGNGTVLISTNGKPDASINMVPGGASSDDEATMSLAAAIPLLMRPQTRTVANIGMGSGLTTHVLLSNRALERVDTIEIEPAMIEAARGFRPRVEAAYSDPRSRFYIDDAKTFFSAHQQRYDLIISEPSNPWVSGVSGLFSNEFYARVRTHLNPNGLFLQWMQLYEIDINLVASVLKAVGQNFPDYVLYASNDSDLIIVATTAAEIPRLNQQPYGQDGLAQELRRVGVRTPADLDLRRIGDRKLLEPLFIHTPIAANSDFFPILDLRAVRSRYLKHHAMDLASLRANPLPALEMLDSKNTRTPPQELTLTTNFAHTNKALAAKELQNFYATGIPPSADALDAQLLRNAMLTARLGTNCRGASIPSLWLDSAAEVMSAVIPHVTPAAADALWRRLQTSDCYHRLPLAQREVFDLLGAIGRRDAPSMAKLAEKLLDNSDVPPERAGYLLSAGMLGYLADGKPKAALQLWDKHAAHALGSKPADMMLRFLLAHSLPRRTP